MKLSVRHYNQENNTRIDYFEQMKEYREDEHFALMQKRMKNCCVYIPSLEEEQEIINEAVEFFKRFDYEDILKQLEEKNLFTRGEAFIWIIGPDVDHLFVALGFRRGFYGYIGTEYISREALDEILNKLKLYGK